MFDRLVVCLVGCVCCFLLLFAFFGLLIVAFGLVVCLLFMCGSVVDLLVFWYSVAARVLIVGLVVFCSMLCVCCGLLQRLLFVDLFVWCLDLFVRCLDLFVLLCLRNCCVFIVLLLLCVWWLGSCCCLPYVW